MRKVLLIAGIMATIMVTACGGEAPTPKLEPEGVEEIQVEEIQIEEIRVEEIRVETIDDSFSEELAYNSKANTWDGPNVTRWD